MYDLTRQATHREFRDHSLTCCLQLHCAFNCGGETARISSTGTYNDTEWHTVTLTRNGGHGKIAVDSEHVFENSVTCVAPAVLAAPYYYGGLRELAEPISKNLEVRICYDVIASSFV